MSLRVLIPGIFTTLQDKGRFGYRSAGIGPGGAMDGPALRMANMLAGNSDDEAVLEMSLQGPSFVFEEEGLIAITGADLGATIDEVPLQSARPHRVRKGSMLTFGVARTGRFGYLALAGGFDIPKVLGSYSTHTKAGFGGFQGRALRAGDRLVFRNALNTAWLKTAVLTNKEQPLAWYPHPLCLPEYKTSALIRVIKGPDWHLLDQESQERFSQQHFQVSQQSDRMGYQLEGPELRLQQPAELLSTALNFGSIQLTPAARAIVLGADHQPTGGYPCIGQVISADLPAFAQPQPRQQLAFRAVSLAEAQQLLLEQAQQLAQLQTAINLKFKSF